MKFGGETSTGAKRPLGAKRPGAKRPGAKRPGGETSRGGNGFGAKRPGTNGKTYNQGSKGRLKSERTIRFIPVDNNDGVEPKVYLSI